MAKINGGKVYGNIISEACAADKYGKSFNICSVRFDSTCSDKNITADAPDIKSVKGHEILKIYFGNVHDDSHCIGTYDINLSNGAYTFTNGKGTNCLSQGNHKIGLQCDLDGGSKFGICKINTGCNIYIDNKYQCQTTFKCEQVNHNPFANVDHFKTDENHKGTFLLGNKLCNDSDSDGNKLSITTVNLAGTPITLTGAGSFVLANVSIVKIANASGDVATFKITTADNSDAGSDPQIAYIHVKANGDEYLENTSDAFGAMSTGQSLKFNFTYSISDGHGGTSSSTEDVTVCGITDKPINHCPIANPDHFKTDEDHSGIILLGNKLTNDTDSDANALTITAVNLAGTPKTLTGAGSFVLANVSIVKIANAPGDVATFKITTADNSDAGSAPQIAYIHVKANGDEYLENTSDAFGAMSTGQSLKFNFTYTISDGHGGISCSTEDIIICGLNEIVNSLPVAVTDSFKTDEDMALNGTVVNNDTPSGDGGNVWSLVGANGGAAHGAVVMNPDGTFTYTPDANYNGNDVFTYQIQDANGDISSTSVKIEICPVNDLPVAVCDSFKTDEDMALNGTVVNNDTPSGDGGNVWSLVGVNGGAAHGAVVMNPDGTFTYTPDANYNGNDVFTYQIQDANGDISSTTVKIEICPVNDLPVAVCDSFKTDEDMALNGTVVSNDTPSGDGGNVWSLVGANGGAAHGAVVMNPDGTFTYTPDANYNGNDVFTYQIQDANGDISSTTVKIEITPDIFVANPDTFNMADDDPLNDTVDSSPLVLGSVLANDTHADPISVIQAAYTGQTFTGSGLAGLRTVALGDLTVANMPLGAGEIAHFSIEPTGALINEAIPVAAELIIGADGEVTLIKNNAFDFLPPDETLTFHFTYDIAESDNLFGPSSSSTFDIIITGTDTNDVFVLMAGDPVTGGLGNDTIYGAGPGQGNTANYSVDVLGGLKNISGNTVVRDYVSGVATDSAAEFAVAALAAGGHLFNYDFSLTSGIQIEGINNGVADGTDTIIADLTTVVNQVLNPTPNSTSSIDLITFGDPHTYLLYNAVKTTASNEWITASVPTVGQEGALIVGGNFTSAAPNSYYVLQGNSGNDVIIGGNTSSTAPSYGYFVIGEGGSNVLIGGDNTGSMDYYVCATDNTNGGFAVPPGQPVGNSILMGGSNLGTGSYYMLGAQGNDVLSAGANALGNTYGVYYLSGGGGTNLFVSNTGKHVFDGTSGSNGAFVHDGFINGIHDVNDTAQYHQDVLGGVTAGDIRAFVNAPSPTLAQMNAVAQAVTTDMVLNYNFTALPPGADPFANQGAILVDAQNAAVPFDGHDILVGDTVTGSAGGTIASPLSSIPNIDFNEASDLSGINHTYTLYNGPITASDSLTIISGSTDAIMVGGDSEAPGNYILQGGNGNDILKGGTNLSSGSDYLLEGAEGNNILIGGENKGVFYLLFGAHGNNVLIGGTNSGSGFYVLQTFTAGSSIYFAGANTGGGSYSFFNLGTGVGMLSYLNIGAGVTVDLGITGVNQNTGGDGLNELLGVFQILQGSNFDDTLSFNQMDVGTSGNPVGGPALVNISSESLYGMEGNDGLTISGTATGGSGTVVGNEATVADQINAEVTLASHILEAGTGTGGQTVSIIGTATGGSADTTFGNHALNGFTAISALVDINGNALASESTTISDTLLIQAHAFGGNAGSTSWDNSTVNTGANVADGLNSKAISAQAIVANSTLVGGVAGASMTINAEATGGNSGPALYGNQALNGAVAISAQVSVEGNHFDGFGNLAGDTLQIIALANGGDVGSGGFTGNVSGFISTPGGTAISAQALVDGNVLTEHGTADAILTINVTANGGNGNFFGNYAFDGTVISADAEVTNNTLTGGSGNDTLTLQATANGGSGPNHADVGGSVAIGAMVTVAGNTLVGGLGNDTLNLFIDANPGGSNTGGSGTEIAAQFVAFNNQLLGGDGNDTLVVNNAAFLDTANTNILDGGNDFDTLIQQISGGSLDITPAGVAGGIVQNMERVDFTGNGSNTLILDGVSVDNLNASHELFVRGDGVDTANIGVGWTFSGTITGAGAGDPLAVDAAVNFNHYTQVVGADTVHLYVDTAMIIV